MPPQESTPLLSNENGNSTPRPPFVQRTLALLKAENEPSWGSSLRFFFLRSYLNILLDFVPLSAAAHYSDWDAGLRFSFSFIAIVTYIVCQ